MCLSPLVGRPGAFEFGVLKRLCTSASLGSAMASDKGEKVFKELGGLGLLWDDSQTVRERVRKVKRVVVDKPPDDADEVTPMSVVAKTIANVRHNHHVLSPLLKMMSGSRDMVPCLVSLAQEFKIVAGKAGFNPSVQALQDQAWSIRTLYGVVKQQTYREKPPTCPILIGLLTDFGIDTEKWPVRRRDSSGSRSKTSGRDSLQTGAAPADLPEGDAASKGREDEAPPAKQPPQDSFDVEGGCVCRTTFRGGIARRTGSDRCPMFGSVFQLAGSV